MLNLVTVAVSLLLTVQASDKVDIENALEIKGLSSKDLTMIENRTYYISPTDTKVSVSGAIAFCTDFNMELLSLETSEEISQVTNFLVTNGFGETERWTSGRELLSRQYYWTSTGRLFTDTNWANGFPDSSECECVYLRGGDKWLNGYCGNSAGFICEQSW